MLSLIISAVTCASADKNIQLFSNKFLIRSLLMSEHYRPMWGHCTNHYAYSSRVIGYRSYLYM